ncbi:hypothetical protein hairong_050 [Pseudomonas phage hairong]|nr:hypothetical protein hairong_050 [Pseudomonas phage hairong]
MASITPYTLDNLDSTKVIDVTWNIIRPFSPDSTHPARMSVSELHQSQHGEFVSSMITCVHPDGGKFWESLFIPTNMTGGTGISITRWGKASTRGQMQVKAVSEHEWYKTVKSKAVSGGYEVKNFIGRQTPLSSDHQFVKLLHEDAAVPSLPAFGFSPMQKSVVGKAAGPEGLGYVMGKALSNIIPTEQFMLNMGTSGHDWLTAVAKAANGLAIESADVVAGFVRGASEHVGDSIASVSKRGVVTPPEPQIDREEVYGGGWGAFG